MQGTVETWLSALSGCFDGLVELRDEEIALAT